MKSSATSLHLTKTKTEVEISFRVISVHWCDFEAVLAADALTLASKKARRHVPKH